MDPKTLKTIQADPAAFRQTILIDADGQQARLAETADPWQKADFKALDGSWRRVCEQTGDDAGIRRCWLERPRGHSKTNDLAVMVTWALFASRRALSGIAAAADRDQARLIRDAIERLVRLNPWLAQFLDVQAFRVRNPHTASDLEILASDVASSYGRTPDFVICDELTHWGKPDLWTSLFSAAAKRGSCLLLVITNAGFGDTWQWEIRETVRNNPNWHFSRLDGPQASWISPNILDEQRRVLPSIAYRRLWLNEWTTGSGDAFEDSDLTAAIVLKGPTTVPEQGWYYVAGLDVGIHRDASALVVVGKHCGWLERQFKGQEPTLLKHRAMCELGLMPRSTKSELIYHAGTGRMRVARVNVWRPERGTVELEQVESRILQLHRALRLQCVGFDPYQCEYLSERLRKQGVPMLAVQFQGQTLQAMATATLDTFRDRQIDLFPDPTLEADLRSLRVTERSYGYRLESGRAKTMHGTPHGDTATSLSIALLLAKSLRPEMVAARARPLVLSPRPWD